MHLARSVGIAALWLMPLLAVVGWLSFSSPNDFTRMTGISVVQHRLSSLRQAGYWYMRHLRHRGSDATIVQDDVLGVLVGATRDGLVAVDVPDRTHYIRHYYKLANLQVTDTQALASYLAGLSPLYVHVTSYLSAPGTVSAIVTTPRLNINLVLIERGVAMPERDPPTGIADLAFAKYFWRTR